jgi:hypothetical protein
MKDYPDSFWAALFILMACMLALASLFSQSAGATAVITMASSIITGAFGYIQGKKSSQDSVQVPVNPSTGGTTVSVNQSAPDATKDK